jgi:putative oxidoreductase
VRRAFSTFAGGIPGVGLAVMRLAASFALAARSIAVVQSGPTIASAAWAAFQLVLAILLLVGLWTPIAGLLIALVELARMTDGNDPWVHILLAALALGLGLVGPGIWSVDARLFGWRRIDLRDRRRAQTLEE